MEYIITFDDGSSAYLAHHGVLGMKWGVRNAETRARYANGPSRAERRRAIGASQDRQRITTHKQATNYLQENAKINASARSGSISKDKAKQLRIQNADRYERDFYKTRAEGRNERAAIKAEGKSDRAKGRIMGRAAGANAYDAATAKGSAYARRQATGKRMAKVALLGISGRTSYDSARAAGKSRLKALGYAEMGHLVGGNLANYDAYAGRQKHLAKKATKAKYRQ